MVVDEFQVWSDIDLHKIKEISRWIKRENVFTVNSSAHSCRLWRAWNGLVRFSDPLPQEVRRGTCLGMDKTTEKGEGEGSDHHQTLPQSY